VISSLGIRACPTSSSHCCRPRAALREQLAIVDKRLRTVARRDPVCHRLMTVPGVRCNRRTHLPYSRRSAGALPLLEVGRRARFGWTPRRYQSGESDRSGAISKAGDASVRVALFEAAHVTMTQLEQCTGKGCLETVGYACGATFWGLG
jgi:transposase